MGVFRFVLLKKRGRRRAMNDGRAKNFCPLFASVAFLYTGFYDREASSCWI
ncbi:hypothetical protein HMPREF7215_1352 [Pyramidobacter piscolens W5455]|uniref:Uncharacterized protein n=1 Tax=Pyramidobacter piscolens W5455 TaxID=352165 RepID=A0ABM9ZY36_9BACT|nr:hypothetical protein HMPREF7215_1352 [Pyramidobacter piscolens W5455]